MPNSVSEAISHINALEAQIDANLSKTINTNHEKTNLQLDLARTELLTLLSASSTLVGVLLDSSRLSKKLTYRVKYLDYQRLRVAKTKAYVSHVIELKNRIAMISEGLERKDWEAVSQSIHYILTEIPPEIVKSSKFANIMIPLLDIPERPEKLIGQWTNSLKKRYVKEFQQAVQAKDTVRLTCFFLYFPKIGERGTGLDCYASFINNVIADQARSLLLNAPRDRPDFYGAALMKLFEIVSRILTQHSAVIAKHYDSKAMTEVLERIQREVDSQAGLIADTFWDVRNFDKVLHSIKDYGFPLLKALQSRESVSEEATKEEENMELLVLVVEIGDYIGEMCSLLSKWSMYCDFVATKYGADQISLQSSFKDKIREKFVPCLEQFTSFYLKKSLEKAFKRETLPLKDLALQVQNKESKSPEQPVTSSAIEDVIMVVNTLLRTGLSAGEAVFAKLLVTSIKKVLHNNFLKILIAKLGMCLPRPNANLVNAAESIINGLKLAEQESQKNVIAGSFTSIIENEPSSLNISSMLMRGASALNALGEAEEARVAQFIVYLNSVAVFKNYFGRIVKSISGPFLEKIYKFGTDKQTLGVLISEEMASPVSKLCERILKEYANHLFSQAFRSKLRSMVTDLLGGGYIVESLALEAESLRFSATWHDFVDPYIRVLAPEAFGHVSEAAAVTIAENVERRLWQMGGKINLLGVIKLEKDISTVINEVTRTNYTLRERFVRVTQIVMIMGFDDEAEESGMEWILTGAEKRKARGMRIDR